MDNRLSRMKGKGAGITKRSIVKRVMEGLRPGAIVLMHVGAAPDGSTLDADVLPTLIRKIKIGCLGAMYYPPYFYGGYAIHSSASVPPYSASHGCVRIPIHSAIGFFERNPIGTYVFVHD